MANKNPSPATRFKKGQSGNPSGRSEDRAKLRETYVTDVYAEWQKRGKDVLAELSPKELVSAAAELCGKDVNVSLSATVEHRGLPEAGERVAHLLDIGTDRDAAALLPH